MIRLAVSGETPGRQYSLHEIAGYLQGYGVDAIEIWPENIPSLGAANHRLFKNRDCSEAQTILERFGIEVACVAFGGAFDIEIAKDETLYSEELVRAVEVADFLGAKFVNHYLYYLSMDEHADTDRLKCIYSPAIDLAEARGITLVLENEAHDSTRVPAEMLRIIEDMNSSFFKTNYDAVNYCQASQEGFPYAYHLLKEHIRYVHVKDGCRYTPSQGHTEDALGGSMTGCDTEEFIYYPLIGSGIMNVQGIVDCLRTDGYKGWITVEPHTSINLWHTYVQAEIQFLKNLLS